MLELTINQKFIEVECCREPTTINLTNGKLLTEVKTNVHS